jgi:serine/threonine protein kinase
MTAQQWDEVKNRFQEALTAPVEAREAFLVQACSDEDVRVEVGRLLDEYTRAGDFLSPPLMKQTGTRIAEATEVRDNFFGSQRFVIQKRLGAGSFGIVYKAFDRERNEVVALKKLLRLDPAHLRRFKREFRSLADLTHPNLVQLYELFGNEHEWFFSMELLDGVDFISYIRRSSLPGIWETLRKALFQLATGVQALHTSARLHRDIKPSNVLVTADGRVVVLDFGLVKELEPASIEQSLALAGSPAYMAPEQAAGGAIDEAADWYAVGVMLYEALTGKLPFTGSWAEILEQKRRGSPVPSRDLAPEAPDDLHEACQHLLQTAPALRLLGKAILLAPGQRNVATDRRAQGDFVGRARELQLLRERFAAVSSGKRQIVLLSGRSGIGKTSLITHFLDGLKQESRDVVILRGRCRESETVPYKAIDPIADQLIQHLKASSALVATGLMPRHPELLKRLFPGFGELEIFSAFQHRSTPDLGEQEIRVLAFKALCELLARMADRSPVVIWIDDLQWGDLDSVGFLAELILPVDAPALMLILSFRSEDSASSAAVAMLQALQPRLKDADLWVHLGLGGLSEQEACQLLNLLQTSGNRVTKKQSLDIMKECRGSPLVMTELFRFALRKVDAGAPGQEMGGVRVFEMIRERARNLSSTAQQLLEALSLAGEPVSKSTLYRAVEAGIDDPARETDLLIREHLVRVTGSSELEPFHDQVREACLTCLSPEEIVNRHSRLAELFESEEAPDPRRLLRHYLGAGNLKAAFEAALAAAKISETALAFEQAAGFYARAIEAGRADESARARLHQKRAEALANAGRGYESAECYLEAARSATHTDALAMRRSAAEQLMRSGHLEEGTRLFVHLLRDAGVTMPAKPLACVIRVVALRAFLRIRGSRWRERTEAEIPAEKLRRLDLLWNGALVLTTGNPIFGNYLQARHMLDALRAGEPFRLALSLGLGVFYESLAGPDEYQRGRRMVDLALELARKLDNSYLSAMAYSNWAALDLLCGRIEDGLAHRQIAESYWDRAGRYGRAWEVCTSNMLLIWFLGWGGRIRELSERVRLLIADGRSRGDLFADVAIRCFTTAHLADLAKDEPDRAISEVLEAIKQWRHTSYDMQHFGATLACVECHLYAGRTEQARRLMLADRTAIRRSLLFRKSQIYKTILFFVEGRTALAEWLRTTGNQGLRREVEEYSSRLEKLGSEWGVALSKLLHAGIAAGLDRPAAAALLLQEAEQIFRRQDLRLLAAAALRRRGELAGTAGTELVEAADTFMRSENIRRPDRMTSMFLPGEWLID